MSDSLRQMIDQMIDLNAYRERADEAIRREHIGDHRGVYQFVCDDVPVLFGSIDALIECLAAERARVAALEAAGDALEEALRMYVHKPAVRLVSWKRVAECRANWRAARQEGT